MIAESGSRGIAESALQKRERKPRFLILDAHADNWRETLPSLHGVNFRNLCNDLTGRAIAKRWFLFVNALPGYVDYA